MRKRLFEIIEVSQNNDKVSLAYDLMMIVTIIVSVIPLAFKQSNGILQIIDYVTVAIFIIDYLLRIITADFKMKKGVESFLIYPFTPMALIDLISILPSLTVLGSGWKLIKLIRLFRTLRVFRVFKVMRYSKSIQMFLTVFRKQKDALITIFAVAVVYVLIAALVILNIEPETFDNYFQAVYWAVVSLTTMGYGDIYPVTVPGQIVTMLSSFVGIAIVSMPAGVITAGFMEELSSSKEQETEK